MGQLTNVGRHLLLVLAIAPIALAAVSSSAATQDGCRTIRECLDKGQTARWNALDTQMILRAQQYREMLELRDQAKRAGNMALLAKVEAALPQARENWEYIDAVARQLADKSYDAFLARRVVGVEKQILLAQAELKQKTAIFDQLRKAQGQDKDSLLRQMEGLAREEQNERLRLALNSGIALADQASRIAAGLAAGVGSAATAAELKKLAEVSAQAKQFADNFAGPNRDIVLAVRGGVAGYKVAKQNYYEATIEGAQIGARIAARALGSAALQEVALLPTTAKMVLGLVSIGLSHEQFGEVEKRFDRLRSEELHWQVEIAVLGARLQSLREDRQRAQEAIRRQALFEQTVRAARAGLQR